VKRIPVWLLIGSLLLGGCARSADPLDWKIECRHIDDLQDWLDTNLDLMPAELAREFSFCFNNIKVSTTSGWTGTVQEREDRICARLRDRTVRAVLIEGNELALRGLTAHRQNESDNLVRLLALSGDAPAPQQKQLDARIQRTQAAIERLKQAEARSEQRLADLRAQP